MPTLVTLPRDTPRDTAAIRQEFDIGHMLRPRAFVGWLFLVGGLCLLLPGLLVLPFAPAKLLEPPIPALSLGGLAEALVGWLLVRSVRRIKRTRLRALTHGQPVPAIVARHGIGVGLGIIIKRLDTVIHFEVHPADRAAFQASFRAPESSYRELLPVGEAAQAMHDPETGATFFPAELGREIVLEG